MADIPPKELVGIVGSKAYKEDQRAKNYEAMEHMETVADTVRINIRPDILEGAEDKRQDPLVPDLGYIPFAYHLVPPRGLAKVAAVMRAGERKGRGGWDHVPIEEHINHAISHLVAYLGKRRGKHHLANAGCRVLMALDLDWEEPLPEPEYDPRPGWIDEAGEVSQEVYNKLAAKPYTGGFDGCDLPGEEEIRPLDQYDRDFTPEDVPQCEHHIPMNKGCQKCREDIRPDSVRTQGGR